MASNAFLARAYGRAVAALGLERKLSRPELVAPVAFERVKKCRVIKKLGRFATAKARFQSIP